MYVTYGATASSSIVALAIIEAIGPASALQQADGARPPVEAAPQLPDDEDVPPVSDFSVVTGASLPASPGVAVGCERQAGSDSADASERQTRVDDGRRMRDSSG
jgi:hypothetical protein